MLTKELLLEEVSKIDRDIILTKLLEDDSYEKILNILYNKIIEANEYDKYVVANFFVKYIEYINNIGGKSKLIKEYLSKMLEVNEIVSLLMNFEDDKLKIIINDNDSTEYFCKSLIEYYRKKVYSFDTYFHTYEYCIDELCKYYRVFKELFDFEDEFLELLRYSISYSGESGDVGYAFKGLEKVEKNIYVLGKSLIIKLLDNFETYTLNNNITVKQLFTIIKSSKLSLEEQEELKFFYVDRKFIEEKLTEII